jgi:hypothetical protein
MKSSRNKQIRLRIVLAQAMMILATSIAVIFAIDFAGTYDIRAMLLAAVFACVPVVMCLQSRFAAIALLQLLSKLMR